MRELQNVIERSLIVCESEVFSVDPNWLGSAAPDADAARASVISRSVCPSTPRTLRSALEEIQRETIQQALESTNGIIGGPRGAAALLGVKRTTLHARMQEARHPASAIDPR